MYNTDAVLDNQQAVLIGTGIGSGILVRAFTFGKKGIANEES